MLNVIVNIKSYFLRSEIYGCTKIKLGRNDTHISFIESFEGGKEGILLVVLEPWTQYQLQPQSG